VNQQINLYQPIFRKQKVVFSALAMVQVLGIIAVVMVGIAGYTAVRLASLEKQLMAAQKYQAVTRQNVDKLKASQLARTPSKLLETEVKRMQSELAERREVARVLSEGALSNTRGFSAQFEGLARRHVSGSWLTEISIRDGGAWMNLRGIALAPEVVPAFLQNLLGTEAFASLKFNVLNLQSVADTAGRVWFEMGTTEKESGVTATKPPGSGAPSAWRKDDAVVGIIRRAN
jgi:hypothetical protein